MSIDDELERRAAIEERIRRLFTGSHSDEADFGPSTITAAKISDGGISLVHPAEGAPKSRHPGVHVIMRGSELVPHDDAPGADHRLTIQVTIDGQVLDKAIETETSWDIERVIERAINTGLAQILAERDSSTPDTHDEPEKPDSDPVPEKGGDWGVW